jgi:hypothetical protein
MKIIYIWKLVNILLMFSDGILYRDLIGNLAVVRTE